VSQRSNRVGLDLSIYRGSKTTLCAGCRHNAISERIIYAFFELGIPPYRVIKLSGIGCSSKSPAYFLGHSFAFNAVHGRMPSIATGALLANRNLLAPYYENIQVAYDPGTTVAVRLHDGSEVRLKKLESDYDPTKRLAAIVAIAPSERARGNPHRNLLHRATNG
jgi:hypothetical protein